MPATAHFSLFAIRMPAVLQKKWRRVTSSLTLAVNGSVCAPIASHGRKSCEQRLLPYTGRWSKSIPEYIKPGKTHNNRLTHWPYYKPTFVDGIQNTGSWNGADGNAYPAGTMFSTFDNGANWHSYESDGFDLHFRTFVIPN